MTNMTCWKKLKCACIRKWKHGRSGDKNIIQFLSTFMRKATTPPFFTIVSSIVLVHVNLSGCDSCIQYSRNLFAGQPAIQPPKREKVLSAFFKTFFQRRRATHIITFNMTISMYNRAQWDWPRRPIFQTDPRVEFISQDHSAQFTKLEHVTISKSRL